MTPTTRRGPVGWDRASTDACDGAAAIAAALKNTPSTVEDATVILGDPEVFARDLLERGGWPYATAVANALDQLMWGTSPRCDACNGQQGDDDLDDDGPPGFDQRAATELLQLDLLDGIAAQIELTRHDADDRIVHVLDVAPPIEVVGGGHIYGWALTGKGDTHPIVVGVDDDPQPRVRWSLPKFPGAS